MTTTLHLPLENENDDRGIGVELEDGYVRIEVELATNELVGDKISRLDDLVRTRLDLVASRAHPQATTIDQDDAEAIFAELGRLERDLESIRNASPVWRALLADEARALAAVLVHFADEAER